MATAYVDGEEEPMRIEVKMSGTERPWVEGSSTLTAVALGVDVELPYSAGGVRLVFPSIDALRRWLRRALLDLNLEAWVQEAPQR